MELISLQSRSTTFPLHIIWWKNIYWTLYAPSGRPISFRFEFHCYGDREEAEPIGFAKFEFEGKEEILLEFNDSRGNTLSEKDAKLAYDNLISLIGCNESELPSAKVKEYVSTCSKFRQRIWNEEPEPQYFFYDLDAGRYMKYWPKMYYDEDP
jgi:hypothetical protein